MLGAGGDGTGSSTRDMCLKRLTKASSQAVATTAMLSSATTAADATAALAVPAAVAFRASQDLARELAMARQDDVSLSDTCAC